MGLVNWLVLDLDFCLHVYVHMHMHLQRCVTVNRICVIFYITLAPFHNLHEFTDVCPDLGPVPEIDFKIFARHLQPTGRTKTTYIEKDTTLAVCLRSNLMAL